MNPQTRSASNQEVPHDFSFAYLVFSSKAAELVFICITLSYPTYPSPPGLQLQVPLLLPPVYTGLAGLVRGSQAEGTDVLRGSPWPCTPVGGTR